MGKQQRDRFPQYVDEAPKVNLRAVAPNLYISGWKAPYTVRPPGDQPWAAIINLSSVQEHGVPKPPSGSVQTVYLGWYFRDGKDFPPRMLNTIEEIVRANIKRGPVLIHCAAGLSRSASAAYAMLRILWGLSHDQARVVVRASPARDPNRQWPVPQTLASARAWVHKRRQG